jgi:hypothetical protein
MKGKSEIATLEIRNPKQIQNTKVQNSKQRQAPTGAMVFVLVICFLVI